MLCPFYELRYQVFNMLIFSIVGKEYFGINNLHEDFVLSRRLLVLYRHWHKLVDKFFSSLIRCLQSYSKPLT